jgi:hypothetical protein
MTDAPPELSHQTLLMLENCILLHWPDSGDTYLYVADQQQVALRRELAKRLAEDFGKPPIAAVSIETYLLAHGGIKDFAQLKLSPEMAGVIKAAIDGKKIQGANYWELRKNEHGGVGLNHVLTQRAQQL